MTPEEKYPITEADDLFDMEFTVEETEGVDIVEGTVTVYGNQGDIVLKTFNIENTGNIMLTALTLSTTGLFDGAGSTVPASSISFIPETIQALDYTEGSDIINVSIEINIPENQAPGTYQGEITVIDDDADPSDKAV